MSDQVDVTLRFKALDGTWVTTTHTVPIDGGSVYLPVPLHGEAEVGLAASSVDYDRALLDLPEAQQRLVEALRPAMINVVNAVASTGHGMDGLVWFLHTLADHIEAEQVAAT